MAAQSRELFSSLKVMFAKQGQTLFLLVVPRVLGAKPKVGIFHEATTMRALRVAPPTAFVSRVHG